MKLKTHKGTAKRFKLSKKGKILKKKQGQSHFNARESGKITRNKRKMAQQSKADVKNIKNLLVRF